MLMTCRQVEHLRDVYLDGELSASLVAEVHAHLLQCPQCQEHFEMFRACGELIAKDHSEPTLDSGFASRVIAAMPPTPSHVDPIALPTRRERRRRFWRVALRSGLPAAAAVLFFGVLLWPTAHPHRPYGEVAGVSINATEVSGVKDVVTPALNAVAETKRAAENLNRLLKFSVGKASQDVRSGAEMAPAPAHQPTFMDILLDPFRDILKPPPSDTIQPSSNDEIVQF